MPKLGLSHGLTRSGIVTPGVVTDNLVMKHMYPAGAVVPLSDGAVDINADADADEYVETNIPGSNFNGDFSFVGWIFPTDITGTVIISAQDGNDDGFRFKLDANSKLESKLNDTTTTADTTLLANTWQHVAFTYNDTTGNAVNIYLNGVLDEPTATVDKALAVADTAVLGTLSYATTSSSFMGYMCNVGVWTGVLTQPQIKSIMWKQYADLTDGDKDAGTTGSSNLVSWYNLDTDATDSTGNYNGSLEP